ncbi:MAG: hypothetical protein AAF798_15100 [Bacteroidota bacterium]
MYKICLFLVFLTLGILYSCDSSDDERFQYHAIHEVPELLQQKARNRLDVYHVRHFANDSTLAFTEAQKEALLLLMANKVYAAEEAKTFIKNNKERRDSLKASS